MASLSTERTGVLKMDVNLNENGNIAQDGDTVAGKKTFSIAGVTSDVTLAQADTLFDAIIGDIAGGSYDTATTVQTLTRKVVE